MQIDFDSVLCFNKTSVKSKTRITVGDTNVIDVEITPQEEVLMPSSDEDYTIKSDPGSTGLVLDKTRFYPEHIESSNLQLKSLKGKILKAEFYDQQAYEANDNFTIKYFLINFPIYEREMEIPLEIQGHKFSLKQYKEGLINQEATFSGVRKDILDEIDKIMDAVCWLSSFASGYLCGITIKEYFEDNSILKRNIFNVDATLGGDVLPTIHNRLDTKCLKQFLESSYNNYLQTKDIYRLNGLIHMGIMAKHSTYRQIKTLIMSNFLEILRHNYAENVLLQANAIKPDGGFYKWVSNNRRATFEQILEHFCRSIGITKWKHDFTEIRNDIVHTGDTPDVGLVRYDNLHEFCDTVILALLDWDKAGGSYMPHNIRPRKWMAFSR